MAERDGTIGDLAVLRQHFLDYFGEEKIDRERLERWLNDPACALAVDPDRGTAAMMRVKHADTVVQVVFMFPEAAGKGAIVPVLRRAAVALAARFPEAHTYRLFGGFSRDLEGRAGEGKIDSWLALLDPFMPGVLTKYFDEAEGLWSAQANFRQFVSGLQKVTVPA